jgi:A/G-specific adenine glycosylase
MSALPAAAGQDPLLAAFAPRLIAWQREHGRHGLPWQQTRDPYRVWLSEVMLQQTQVSTVLTYFDRFLQRFPDVHSLAEAPADAVMSLWAGLGYYSRARNLHRCAQVVVQDHGGVFPPAAAQLQTLPGIGASTAAAIAAFCFGERVSIVDGNVRRVLARLLAFDQDLAQAASQRQLWALAQGLLPPSPTPADMSAYTQGLMDLGATVCRRSQPLCERCPVQALCQARSNQTVTQFPVKSSRVKRRSESWWLLMLQSPSLVPGGMDFWLERRPAPGIWAGLFCPPVLGSEAELQQHVPAQAWQAAQHLPAMTHNLTHRELRLHPVVVSVDRALVAERLAPGEWVTANELSTLGLPTPVRSLYQQLAS